MTVYPPKTCAYCKEGSLTHENGLVVTYKSDAKAEVAVPLHKSCAPEWSRQFTQSVSVQVTDLE